MAEAKFDLEWREHQPVLDYALRGFWTIEDADEWVGAVRAALATKPSGPWYMCGDLTELKAQKEEVNELRNAVTQMTLAAGLSGCVMVSEITSSSLQLKRLLNASPNPDLYRYVSTREEAEAEIQSLLSVG